MSRGKNYLLTKDTKDTKTELINQLTPIKGKLTSNPQSAIGRLQYGSML